MVTQEEMNMPRVLFPVLIGFGSGKIPKELQAAGVFNLRAIPWEMIAPHAAQAKANHYQSLERLADRGGLSACEMVAVLEDRPWTAMPTVEAYRRLNELFNAAAAAVV